MNIPKSPKIIFAGTPEFAAHCLKSLIDTHYYDICAVLTRPDSKAGRGRKLQENPVKKLALKYKLPIFQPKSLKKTDIQQKLAALKADVLIDVACGLLIPKTVLDIPRLGCFNAHPSLLPRFRGAAPIQRAILAGDKETGVSIMKMDEGWDTGPIALQEKLFIQPDETAGELEKRLMVLAADLLKKLLSKLTQEEEIILQPQNESHVCYANKIKKADAEIDWQKTANELYREIRAFNPVPVSYAHIGGKTLRVWRASLLDEDTKLPAGQIIRLGKTGIDVATGKGLLRLQILQFPGGKVQTAGDLLNSKRAFFETNRTFQCIFGLCKNHLNEI